LEERPSRIGIEWGREKYGNKGDAEEQAGNKGNEFEAGQP
jgi:hypothetical protein